MITKTREVKKVALIIKRQRGGLVVMIPACCVAGLGFKPRVGSQRIFTIDFHQQKLSSLAIACNVKLERALYLVFGQFYAEASKEPWTSLN